ncbi:MAG: hypothetical protein JWM88_3283 [Verrucomicrobia bacterium]|nr:hypothetical protein [Verrucomicrobiota bacterium]
MKLVVISPETEDPRELAVMGSLLAAGLERYHVRKPVWSREQLRHWLTVVPAEWRPRLVLHQHHQLVDEFGLGGRHWRDMPGNAGGSTAPFLTAALSAPGRLASRSCHELGALQAAFDRYDSIFFGPIFPTMSKPGYGPSGSFSPQDVSLLLRARTAEQRRASVLALGGITAETAPRAIALGFDGVAVLGAIWQSEDPVGVFTEIRESVRANRDEPAAAPDHLHSDHAA